MGEIAVRQAILHGLIAAGVVEATLRTWRIRRAESRLRFWLLAFAFPFLVLPLLLIVAPFRATDRFAAGWALFASERWSAVRLAGIGSDTAIFGLLILSGTLLFLRDVVPFLVAAVRERREDHAPHAAPSPALVEIVADLAGRACCAVPAITVLRTDAPILLVRGVVRRTLVLSDGVLTRLSAVQLQAAVAHELAHVRFRDPLAGWALMTARLAMFWNPAVQLMARAIVQEMEHRADGIAAGVTDAETFAGALRRLAALPQRPGLKPGTCGRSRVPDVRRFRPSLPVRSGQAGRDMSRRIELLAERLHHAHIAARVTAVLAPLPPRRVGWTRLAVVGATLGVLVFFVV